MSSSSSSSYTTVAAAAAAAAVKMLMVAAVAIGLRRPRRAHRDDERADQRLQPDGVVGRLEPVPVPLPLGPELEVPPGDLGEARK